MKKTRRTGFLGLIFLMLATVVSPTAAIAAKPQDEIMFILDASSSMLYKDGTDSTRIDRAKAALTATIQALPSDANIGVRVYGSVSPESDKTASCQDSVLLSSPKPGNAEILTRQITDIQSRGWTPIAKALNDVKGDFSGEGRKTVILLSDGIDTCAPAQACQAAKNLAQTGADIKVSSLGFVVNQEAREQLQCIANDGGGEYYDVNDVTRLQEGLSALAQKQITSAENGATPIECSNELSDAPALIAGTRYVHTLSADESVFCSFDALPKQKITITAEATDTDGVLDLFNFLNVKGYVKLDGAKLSATGMYGETQRFSRETSETVTVTYDIDTARQKLNKPQHVAFSLQLSRNEANVPVFVTVAATGGEAPNNDSEANASETDGSMEVADNGSNLLMYGLIFAGILATVTVMAVLGLRKKRSKK